MHFCMILIACCLCLSFKNMGGLTKWGDLMNFLDVYYYVIPFFLLFVFDLFVIQVFLFFCYFRLVKIHCSFSNVFWWGLCKLHWNCAIYQVSIGLIYLLVGLLMGLVVYWLFVCLFRDGIMDCWTWKNKESPI